MAEPEKDQIGDGQDNFGQAAGKAIQAAKQISHDAAAEAAVKGAEATANAAAAVVQASTESGKAVAEIAAGTAAGGPWGAILSAAWAMRHSLFKVLVCICLFLLIIVILICSIPSIVLDSVFGLNGVPPAEGVTLESSYSEMSNAVSAVIDAGYDQSLARVEEGRHPGSRPQGYFVFLSGLGVLLYPYIRGYLVDRQIERTAEEFLSRVETDPISPYPSESQLDQDTPSDSPEPTEPDTYTDLWRDMVDYNKEIYINGQKGLDCKLAYEDPSFVLADYGLESEVFAVISIPALELEMPVFLGANYRHMADGAALLGQTSIPIGGKNTNCIIAGHRGWGGASYFRYVDKLQPGDEVIITNLWETLQYRVAEIQIIQPNEVEQILIKPGQELVTLLTCHPYASGGRQRYLVICERVNENN